MKKQFLISLLFSVLTLSSVFAQAIKFRKTFSNVTITSVSQTADDGYIIAGYSTAYGLGSKDIVLIKTDSTGAMQWSNTFGNNVNANADDISANAVEITSGAGGYYLAGQFWNQLNNTYEVYVLRTDASGNKIWSKTMYNGGYDRAMSVVNASGGGCIVTGWIGNSSKGYLCRLDANGTIVWQNSVYYVTNAWILQSGKETNDGGIISCGYDNELGYYEMWLVKTNASGVITWQKGYAMGGTYNFCYDVCQANDNGYLLAGGSNGINLAKTDSNGTIVWAKTYSGGAFSSPRAYSVKQCSDHGYIVLGNDISNNQYLMKIDSTGAVEWATQYSGGYFLNTVEQTNDGGYVLAMGSDIIKTDAMGITGCNETPFTMTATALTLITRTPTATTTAQIASNVTADGSTTPSITVSLPCPALSVNNMVEENEELSIFPNPVFEKFKIQIPLSYGVEFKVEKIELINIIGEQVLEINFPEARNEIEIDVKKLNRGVYFIKVLSSTGIIAKKIILE